MRNYDAVPGISSLLVNPDEAQEVLPVFFFPSGRDCRVRLLAVVAGTLGAFLLKSEVTLGLTALLSFIWLVAFKQLKTGLLFLLCYCLLAAMQLLTDQSPPTMALMLLAGIFRRMLLPAVLAIPLAKAPMGTLIATLNKLHIPRSMTMALTVMLRFMPTVFVEYRAIRRAQKYRGIGVSWWQLLLHPARSYETILVPLLIRTTRMADELAASAMLRGAAGQKTASSFRIVRMNRWDVMIAGSIFALTLGLLLGDWVLRR